MTGPLLFAQNGLVIDSREIYIFLYERRRWYD